MSLFGSLMADVEDDLFFGSHMRHMHQMNNMMNTLFSDPFAMFGGGQAMLAGPRHTATSLMPYMPPMPSINRLFTGNLEGAHMSAGSSYSSSTVVMSSGPNGKPQVYSSTSSTKIGPNGLKETRKTLQDTRTGTKKMSIGHHIGERAHLIEREQNVYSGDAEERQEFINLDEDEAEDFDREFQVAARSMPQGRTEAILAAPRRDPPRLALTAPPPPLPTPNTSSDTAASRRHATRPHARRPIRTAASPLAPNSSNVREVYSGSHPQRHRNKNQKSTHRHSGDN